MKTRNRAHGGFSLAVCLLVLVLLSILVVSFLSTVSLDHTTSRAYARKAAAEAAARSAVNHAISLVADSITRYPDSATAWESQVAGSRQTRFEGTVLHLREGPNAPGGRHLVLPLVSRPDTLGNLLAEVPADGSTDPLGKDEWNEQTMVNLNRTRFAGDKDGWIGSPSDSVQGASVPKPVYARWVNLKEQPESGPQTQRTIARYAFWAEDESFRLNLNMLGAQTRGAESLSPGSTPAEIPMRGLLGSLPMTANTNLNALAQSAVTLRNGWLGSQLLELRAFNRADSAGTFALGDRARFLGTVHSGGLNLSRHGSQRVNLNNLLGLETQGFDWKRFQPRDAEADKQVRQLVETIRFHTPKFGERFYRSPATASKDQELVTAPHREIYLYKLAANIRDYIDPDLQPTLIDNRGHVVPRSSPTSAINADVPNSLWAQGKDSGPYLQEAVARYRTSVTGRTYQLRVDYYLEFWNMGSKDIYAAPQPAINEPHSIGPGAFVRIANQQAWLSSPGGALLRNTAPAGEDPIQDPRRDMTVDLTNGVFCNGFPVPGGVKFKAGEATVITTDPEYFTPPAPGATSPAFSGGYNKANVYYCSRLLSGRRTYSGPLSPSSVTGIMPNFRDAGQDYDTEIILGNPNGVIDSHPAAIAMGGGAKITTAAAARDDWYGGTLLGNGTTPSQLGDPRANNEALSYVRFRSGASTAEPDQARYFNTVGAPRFSLGYPNDTYLNCEQPNAWPDFYKGWVKTTTNTALNPGRTNAPAFTYNGRITSTGAYDPKLASIGQLGDVFDPSRLPGNKGTLGVAGSRGGGRTLRIGQKDDLINGSSPDATSRQWAAWRLTDFFDTSSDVFHPGLININGIRRDDGAALRAACEGMTLHAVAQAPADARPIIADVPLNSDLPSTSGYPGVHKVINQMLSHLNAGTPGSSYFRERGELSELPIFSSATVDLLPSVKMSTAFDRTREEFCRRLMNMITTRGNIFSVYAVGQAIAESKGPTKTSRPVAEHRVKVTFALLPRNADDTPFEFAKEDFDPTQPKSIATRFAPPDHYDIQILEVSYP